MAELQNLSSDTDELRRQFIEYGGNPNTKTIRQGELTARSQARAEYAQAQKQVVESRGRFANAASELVTRGMQGVAVLLTLVLVVGGLTVALTLLIVAEWAAVQKGFSAIDPTYAPLYSAATVFFFVSTLFIREVIARNATRDDERVFSLRYVAQWLVYFLGFNRNWRPQYRRNISLLNRVDSAVRWLTYTIVLFGLLGRLFDTINGLNGSWLDALQHIITQSTFTQMMGYVGSVVMTIGLLLATHFAVFFVHSIYVNVTGGLKVNVSNFFEVSLDDLVDAQTLRYWQDAVLIQREKFLLKAANQTSLQSQIDQTSRMELPRLIDDETQPSETVS